MIHVLYEFMFNKKPRALWKKFRSYIWRSEFWFILPWWFGKENNTMQEYVAILTANENYSDQNFEWQIFHFGLNFDISAVVNFKL